jgi:hypothetical protein
MHGPLHDATIKRPLRSRRCETISSESTATFVQTSKHTFIRFCSFAVVVCCYVQIEKLAVVHVAGTKGKGSTCAMTERLLRATGLRTGLFTSPHLITEMERFRINGIIKMIGLCIFLLLIVTL